MGKAGGADEATIRLTGSHEDRQESDQNVARGADVPVGMIATVGTVEGFLLSETVVDEPTPPTYSRRVKLLADDQGAPRVRLGLGFQHFTKSVVSPRQHRTCSLVPKLTGGAVAHPLRAKLGQEDHLVGAAQVEAEAAVGVCDPIADLPQHLEPRRAMSPLVHPGRQGGELSLETISGVDILHVVGAPLDDHSV